ncbi:lantibiotic dehydratase [Staphylococcus aureus]|nr:lantibiotic dehydratase [Staphylococcus aureus]
MIHVSNYFMVRKPSFNFSDYSILSDEEFVNLTLKEQIKTIWKVPKFKEAICVASQDLYKSCLNLDNKKSKDIKSIHNSLIKYYIRMCTRSTPFGLFSSFFISEFCDDLVQQDLKREQKIYCLLSNEWLENFIFEVINSTDIVKNLHLRVNKSLRISKNKISLYFIPGQNNLTNSISINNNNLNAFILNYLNINRSFNDVLCILQENGLNLTPNILLNYIKDLVSKGFIITELQKGNFYNIDTQQLKTILEKCSACHKHLKLFNKLLSFTKQSVFDLNNYIECVAESQKLIPGIIPFQVESVLGEEINLNSTIKNDLKEIAKIYYSLNKHWIENDEYIEEFMEKYGINIAVNIKELAYKGKHLGLGNRNIVKRENNFLSELAFNISKDYKKEVDISNFIDLEDIEYSSPASFDLYFRIHEDNKGHRTYFPSGNIITNESHRTFGRFLKYFDDLSEEICIEKQQCAKNNFSNIISYGISFKPMSFKALNVMKTPQFFKENVFFNSFENDDKLNNIYVFCDEKGKIHFYDNYKKKKIHLSTTNMMNYESNSPDLCRFLLSHSENNYIKSYPINNSDLEKFHFFPRIVHNNIVLRLKKWKFKSHISTYAKIIELYNQGHIDRFVNLVQLDNFILLDLENIYSEKILKKELLKNEDYIELEEAEHLINNSSIYKEYEFVVPINIQSKSHEERINNVTLFKDSKKRILTINDSLIYIKIYFSLGYREEILQELHMYLTKENISDYFFIQYNDPKPHIRLRLFSSPENLIHDLKIIEYLHSFEFVKKIDIADYDETYNNDLELNEQSIEMEMSRLNLTDDNDINEIIAWRGEQEKLEQKRDAYKKRYHEFEMEIARLESLTKDKELLDSDKLKDEYELKKEKMNTLIDEYSAVHYQCQNNINKTQSIVSHINYLNQELKDQQEIFQLAEIVSGKNNKNLTLENFVLIYYLDQIIAQANLRLATMSDNRYQLIRREAVSHGLSGLEIDVFDLHSNKSRHISSLSGGETFQSSLALALGLSEIVQQQSGGISLESIFIDEGFGTLDQETLETALDTLLNLKSTGRMVGIISHVSELKNRIPLVLEVKSDQYQSSTRFKRN